MAFLVCCDDVYHPAGIIQTGLEQLPEFDFEFRQDHELGLFKNLAAYDGLILAKLNHLSQTDNQPWLTSEIEAEICQYLQAGGRVLFLHAGIVLLNDAPTLAKFVGCSFDYHPEQMQVSGQGLTAEVIGEFAEFTAKDEHYFIHHDGNLTGLFLETKSAEGKQIGGYLRPVGSGKVAVLTPGHTSEMWAQANFQGVVRQTLGALGVNAR